MKIKRRDPAVIVMDALLKGITVDIGLRSYSVSDYGELCQVGTIQKNGGEAELCLLHLGLPWEGFVNLCHGMTDDEVAIVVMNLTMEKLSATNRLRRALRKAK